MNASVMPVWGARVRTASNSGSRWRTVILLAKDRPCKKESIELLLVILRRTRTVANGAVGVGCVLGSPAVLVGSSWGGLWGRDM